VPGSADEKGAARYRLRLFSIAYGMTGSVGDAEDTEVNCRQIFARAGQRIAPRHSTGEFADGPRRPRPTATPGLLPAHRPHRYMQPHVGR